MPPATPKRKGLILLLPFKSPGCEGEELPGDTLKVELDDPFMAKKYCLGNHKIDNWLSYSHSNLFSRNKMQLKNCLKSKCMVLK